MNTLVTCAFLGLLEDKQGGRPKAWEQRYLEGISHLRNNTWKKMVYVSPYLESNMNRLLSTVCDDEQLARFEVLPFDINACEFSRDLDRIIKEPTGARSLHVQYGKFWFMQQSTQVTGNTYWIDAGLVSSTLFPNKIFPDQAHLVFTDEYLEKLINRVNNKIYVIVGNRKNGFAAPGDRTRELHPVGGFHGGCNDSLRVVLDRYRQHIIRYMSNDTTPDNEIVLEDDFYQNKQDYIFDEFDSWYHEDHMIEQYALINNKKFYQVFTNN